MKSTQNIQNASFNSCLYKSTEQKILVDFLINKTNNDKWLNYSRRKLFARKNNSSANFLQPEDFVSHAKEIIYNNVVITSDRNSQPVFRIIKNGRSFSGKLENLNRYIFSLIFWEISNTCRIEEKTTPLSLNKKTAFLTGSNEYYENNDYFLSKDFIEKCYEYLENIDHLKKEVFDYKLNGVPNRIIAKNLRLEVRDIENILKSIYRLLQSLKPSNF